MDKPPKPTDKESVQVELNSLLSTAHGEITQAAEGIAKALDELIKAENIQNREKLESVVRYAMSIPGSHLSVADQAVREGMTSILAGAQEVITSGLKNLIEVNQKIKDDKRKLKARIKQIESQPGQRPVRGK